MPVIVKRKSSSQSQMIKLKIKIDGKTVGKISNGSTEIIYPQSDRSELSVTEFMSRSNKVVVEDGDSVEIQAMGWPIWYLIIVSVLAVYLRTVFLSVYSLGMTTSIVSVVYIVPFTLFKSYKLTKLTPISRNQENKE